MSTTWNRLALGAILLTSLLLFLSGCSGGGGGSTTSASKTITGAVSDSKGMLLQNAVVTAYAVSDAGTVASSPLSIPATVLSDGQGIYRLHLPDAYQGKVMVQAAVGSSVYRAFLPSLAQEQTLMLSLATEMTVQYILVNKAGNFTAENLQKAILMLEPFFGPNFTQVAPPAIGEATNDIQQGVLVMTQAVSTLLASGHTVADMVKLTAANRIGLGEEPLFTELNNAIGPVTTELKQGGLIAGNYTQPPIIPITEPQTISTAQPSPPSNLVAVPTASSVTLTWAAAAAGDNVTSHYIYRDGVAMAAVAAPGTTYTDILVGPATTYSYTVMARNASGNVSSGATVSVTTHDLAVFSLSGRVTYNGAPLPFVTVTISGAGFGSTVTDSEGKYAFAGARAGSYTITLARSGYAFSPAFRSFIVTNANLTGLDFTATQSGAVNGQTTYPNGTVTATTTYPNGTVIGGTTYPPGSIVTTITYPDGTITIAVTLPNGAIIGSTVYPAGTVIASTTFPDGTVTSTTTYPDGSVVATTTYPNGTISTAITYPDGIILGGTTFPAGTVITTTTYPNGIVAVATAWPSGAVSTTTTYPNGTVSATAIYPNGTVIGNTTYPSGTIISTTTYPNGAVVGGTSYPSGTVITVTTYPKGAIVGGASYPSGVVVTTTKYPNGRMTTDTTSPTGTVSVTLNFPG